MLGLDGVCWASVSLFGLARNSRGALSDTFADGQLLRARNEEETGGSTQDEGGMAG